MSYSLQQHLAYNVWANGKVAEFIAKEQKNIFDSEVNPKTTFLVLSDNNCSIINRLLSCVRNNSCLNHYDRFISYSKSNSLCY